MPRPKKTWGEKMKAKPPHHVILDKDFAGIPHMSLGSCLVAMKRMTGFDGYTPHGLRSTFRDWAAETTGFANETLELALAHAIQNKAEAAYRRQDQLEKRVKLMQQWQQFVDTAPKVGNVVLLQKEVT